MSQPVCRAARQPARQRAAAQPDSLPPPGRSGSSPALRPAACGGRLVVCPVLAAGLRPSFKAAVRRIACVFLGFGAAAALAACRPALSRGDHTDLRLSAGRAAGRLSAAGICTVADGPCRALSAGGSHRGHADLSAAAFADYEPAVHRFDARRFFHRRQGSADPLPGVPAARPLARTGQARPSYTAAAGRVCAGIRCLDPSAA